MTKNKKSIFNVYKRKEKAQKMTLIIGGNCKDGIVLVADRKVLNSKQLVNKIRKPKDLNVVFTAGGYESIFEDYITDLTKNVDWSIKWLEEENKKSPVHRDYDFQQFKKQCIQTLTELKETYSSFGENTPFDQILQVFFTIPENRDGKAITRLYKMDMEDCLPVPVEENRIEAIGYKTLAMPLLKSLENGSDITIRDVARVATFAIKYIEKEDLTEGAVGVGNMEPQIYFERHGENHYEVTGDELTELLQGVNEQVELVRSIIGSTSNFLR